MNTNSRSKQGGRRADSKVGWGTIGNRFEAAIMIGTSVHTPKN